MTTVKVAAGTLQGIRENGVHAFLGVPYAAPVKPERRFDAPQPVSPWQGVRDATQLGPVCPQIPTYGPVGAAATSKLAFGEDFLTVNIRTPDTAGRAPVLFWIHGGGYAVGSANEPVLQSGAFAASGIVEITVNYRLGALGFLHLEGRPDNRGLLDLVAALEWVRDNIAAFGGDPDQVTLAGRSAGGFAVAALMAMPDAQGLFHRAMPQSGASTGVASMDDAERLTRRFLAAANADEASLAALPMNRLLEIQRDLCNQSYEEHDFARDGDASMLGVPFVPVIEGASLPKHPETAAREGRTDAVPMMIGCTTGEHVTHAIVQPKMDFALCAGLLHERVLPRGLIAPILLSAIAWLCPTTARAAFGGRLLAISSFSSQPYVSRGCMPVSIRSINISTVRWRPMSWVRHTAPKSVPSGIVMVRMTANCPSASGWRIRTSQERYMICGPHS